MLIGREQIMVKDNYDKTDDAWQEERQVKCPNTACESANVGINKQPNRYICHDCGKYFTYGANKVVKSPLKALSRLEVLLNTKQDRVRIIPFGDIHVGAEECDWNKVERELVYILKTPDCYLIGMGDYMDCASKMVRKGPNIFESILSPMQQYEKILNAFKPLAEEGKVLGLLTGNHEGWISEDSGMDIVAMLCMALDVPYLGSACDLVINVNGQRYTGYVQHGSSAAKLGATKIAAMMNATREIYADFFCYGHVHQVAATKCARRLEGKEYKSYYVLTGHFLKWEGGYAQAFGISPSPTGVAKMYLFADRKDIHVIV